MRLIDADEAIYIATNHLINPYEIISFRAVIDKTPTIGIENLNRCYDNDFNSSKTQIVKIKLDTHAIKPTRAYITDAGLDLYSPVRRWVFAGDSALFDTGVHIELPYIYINGVQYPTTGFVKSKSGLNVNHDLVTEGVIDLGYTGSIKVKLHNLGKTDYLVNQGDKIAQLVILPVLTPDIRLVNSLPETARGDKGFGSSGR
ncbi:dUTP diphosphatase [Fumia xinanensis]|uniref:dUTP diphosphatase n=1 Tax=Fumia xinanensis TaxID=2763659 RepID=A0A926I6D8_9FIRM|nr:dUTP diphosphatase [Fumia xinanensis]MBC8558884.1 dUTP diphosphatase [Fumia xinanensis]